MYGVTSISLVDWNKGILADFHSADFSGNETEQTRPVDTGDNPGYTVIENSLTGDTFTEEYAMTEPIEGNCFGFHIVQGVMVIHCKHPYSLYWILNGNKRYLNKIFL